MDVTAVPAVPATPSVQDHIRLHERPSPGRHDHEIPLTQHLPGAGDGLQADVEFLRDPLRGWQPAFELAAGDACSEDAGELSTLRFGPIGCDHLPAHRVPPKVCSTTRCRTRARANRYGPHGQRARQARHRVGRPHHRASRERGRGLWAVRRSSAVWRSMGVASPAPHVIVRVWASARCPLPVRPFGGPRHSTAVADARHARLREVRAPRLCRPVPRWPRPQLPATSCSAPPAPMRSRRR
jgi:hypothetical protein